MNTIAAGNVRSYYSYNRETARQKRNLRRKQLQCLKRKLFFVTVSFAFIFMLCIAFGTFLSNAKPANEQEEYKYFTRHIVGADETLWEIALEYADEHYDDIQAYMEEVQFMNHLHDINDIQAGSELLLPYYSNEYLQ